MKLVLLLFLLLPIQTQLRGSVYEYNVCMASEKLNWDLSPDEIAEVERTLQSKTANMSSCGCSPTGFVEIQNGKNARLFVVVADYLVEAKNPGVPKSWGWSTAYPLTEKAAEIVKNRMQRCPLK